MSLLRQIQESIVQEGADLGSVLLKLRLLASRLGSGILEEWVKHESEGYPKDAEVPPYRTVEVSYKGTFFGPFNAQIMNAPIPQYLIRKFGGKQWVSIGIRESIAAVDAMVKSTKDGGDLGIDASNLILLLQGKIYKGYACNAIDASISPTSLVEIIQAVRGRVLELTLELEKKIPAAAHISFGEQVGAAENAEKVQQISQQIIYGNVTNAVSGSSHAVTSATVVQGDVNTVERFLQDAGIPQQDARAFATILSEEEPKSSEEPLGKKAQAWIADNVKSAATGAWKAGVAAATTVLTKAALAYYGLG